VEDENYSSHTYLGVVRKLHPTASMFKAFFFTREIHFDTDEVKLDKVDDSVNMAAFVSPLIDGKVNKNQGFSTQTLMPPHVKDKHDVDLDRVFTRQAGQAPNVNVNSTDKRNAVIIDNFRKEDLAIDQTEQWMASQAVLFGQYNCEGEEHPMININLNRDPDNTIVLSLAARWSEQNFETYNPMDDIEEAAEQSEADVNVVIMDKLAWRLFKQFKAVKDVLDNRRGTSGSLELALKDLGRKVSWKGQCGNVDIVVNMETVKISGNDVQLMPDYGILLCHSNHNEVFCYGRIKDDRAIRNGEHVSSRYMKVFTETGDVEQTYTVTKSSPLALVTKPNEMVYLNVGGVLTPFQ